MSGRGTKGLTLLELVVAMAIFALVAVMGLQALTGALRMRDRLAGIDTDTAELGFALGLLRRDMGALVPLVFYPPGAAPRSALDPGPGGRSLGLSLAGQPDLQPVPGPGLQRVEWRLDPATNELRRRVWPTLYPAGAGDVAPDMVVLRGVRGLSLRTYWPDPGWVEGSISFAGAAPSVADDDTPEDLRRLPNSYSGALPQALELTLDTADHGRIVVLESLK